MFHECIHISNRTDHDHQDVQPDVLNELYKDVEVSWYRCIDVMDTCGIFW